MIFIVFIGFFFVLPRIRINSEGKFNEYTVRRTNLVTQYNTLSVTLKEVLFRQHRTIDIYKESLTMALSVLDSQERIVSDISTLNVSLLNYKTSEENSNQIKQNLETDSKKLEEVQSLKEQVEERIKYIKTINQITNLTYCFRKITNKYSLQECSNMFDELNTLMVTSIKYKALCDDIFVNYFDLSNSQKINRINRVIDMHNEKIDKLEDLINNPIIFK